MATQISSHNRTLDCSEAEWAARLELAACYRIFDHFGWSESIYNHISVKVPDEEGAFLINPFGLLYSEVCASNLVKIDIAGNILDGSPYPVNKAGFTQHGYFHANVPSAHAICHSHTTATMAVCSMEGGLQPVNFYACNFMGRLAYHDFEGITVRAEEAERLLANLGDKRILMLKNHGPVILGRSIPEIFITHWSLQRACEVQLATMAAGKPIVVSDEVVAVHLRDLHEGSIPGTLPGATDFAAWTRAIDKIDRSWRD
jgi:ribulose-5-phosphate 4-epimerase/fuculose-1-phosphate aldolase